MEMTMNKLVRGRLLLLVAFVASALMCGQVVASPQESAGPSLDLSSDVEGPGYEVTITVYLRVPEDVRVGKAISEITYPFKILEFIEAIRGLSAEAVAAR